LSVFISKPLNGVLNVASQQTRAVTREVALAVSMAELAPLIESQPLQASNAILEMIGHPGAQADAGLLGDLYCKLGNCRITLFDPAGIRDFELALEHAIQSGNRILEARVLEGLARTFLTFGDSNSALQYCEKAIAVGRKLEDKKVFAQILMTLGLTFAVTEQFDRSIGIYDDAAKLCESTGDKPGLARVLNNWADVLIIRYESFSKIKAAANLHMLDDAIQFARRAMAYAEESGLFRLQLLIMETLAHGMEERGMYAVAQAELETGLIQLAGHGFVKEELDIQVRLGALQSRMKQSAAAIERLTIAKKLALELATYPHMPDLLRTLSTVYEADGDFSSALAAHKEFHAASLKSRDQRAQVSAQIFSAKLDLERAQQEAEAHRFRVDQLENFNRSLREQANEDPLTGLPNRRALEECMDRILAGNSRNVTFSMLDIDFFKQVNDTFSHLVGDDVLRHLGALVQRCLRGGDMVARIGGEEFALVIERTRGSRSVEACERIRKAIQAYDWAVIAADLHITASFGVTHVKDEDDLRSLMGRADKALYGAKRNGRNRVEKI
jgi:diguanylate cyclase (GGDEF)-like protein